MHLVFVGSYTFLLSFYRQVFMMLSFFMMSSRCSAERHLAGVPKQCWLFGTLLLWLCLVLPSLFLLFNYYYYIFKSEFDEAILGTHTCSNTNSSSSYGSACCYWWMPTSVHYGSKTPSLHIKFTWNRDRRTCLYRLTFTSPQQKILFAKRISDIRIY